LKDTFKKIVREDNFLSLAGNLVIAFFGFAGFALLARSFPLDVFGEWVIFIASGSFIEMFRFGITNTAIIRYLSGAEKEERLKFIGSNGLIGLTATIFVVSAYPTCGIWAIFHLVSLACYYQPSIQYVFSYFAGRSEIREDVFNKNHQQRRILSGTGNQLFFL